VGNSVLWTTAKGTSDTRVAASIRLTHHRAVAGTSASPALATRQADCSAYFSPLPTPVVPDYAKACKNGAAGRYSSACSCLGVTKPTATCVLNGPKATSIVKNFAYLLTHPQAKDFQAKANAIIGDKFQDTSASINYLAGMSSPPVSSSWIPASSDTDCFQSALNAVTFPNKQAFIAGQSQQPPIPSLQTLDIFYTCNKIAWRWLASGIGSTLYDVKGIETFTIDNSGKISEVFVEFNSAPWVVDIAGTCSPPSVAAAPPPSGTSSAPSPKSSAP
jgi:hypothetical protein